MGRTTIMGTVCPSFSRMENGYAVLRLVTDDGELQRWLRPCAAPGENLTTGSFPLQNSTRLMNAIAGTSDHLRTATSWKSAWNRQTRLNLRRNKARLRANPNRKPMTTALPQKPQEV